MLEKGKRKKIGKDIFWNKTAQAFGLVREFCVD
jgi:hypothetical protein